MLWSTEIELNYVVTTWLAWLLASSFVPEFIVPAYKKQEVLCSSTAPVLLA